MSDANTAKVWIDGLTLLLAAVVAAAGFYRFTVEKRKDREAKARERWAEYLQDAARHVRFMNGFWERKDGAGDKEIAAYRLFISRVMWACEDAVLAFDTPDWKECINETLDFHKDYFETDEFRKHLTTLHPKLLKHLLAHGCVPEADRAAVEAVIDDWDKTRWPWRKRCDDAHSRWVAQGAEREEGLGKRRASKRPKPRRETRPTSRDLLP